MHEGQPLLPLLPLNWFTKVFQMGIQLVYKKMFENKWHFWLAGLQPIEGTLPHVTTLCLSIRTLGAKLSLSVVHEDLNGETMSVLKITPIIPSFVKLWDLSCSSYLCYKIINYLNPLIKSEYLHILFKKFITRVLKTLVTKFHR